MENFQKLIGIYVNIRILVLIESYYFNFIKDKNILKKLRKRVIEVKMIDIKRENQPYYFINKEIIIVKHKNLLNMAIVRYVDSIREFIVDKNFIREEPLNEHFICISDLTGRERNDS